MDADHPPSRPDQVDAVSDRHAKAAGNASAIIGSDEFVERLRRAMAIGVRRAMEENAALHRQTEKPKP